MTFRTVVAATAAELETWRKDTCAARGQTE